MKSSRKTFAELQAWLDTWNENHAAPSANSIVDFLGIELGEPETPVGQRRRSPDGVEAVKTDVLTTDPWRRYRGDSLLAWFTDNEVAGWEVITDAPEAPKCNLNWWASDELRAELARRGESS